MDEESEFDWNTDTYPDTYDFTEHSICEGTIADMRTIEIGDRESQFITVQTKYGLFTVWLNVVLLRKVEEQQIRIGDYIGIRYLGTQRSERGYTYKNYEVKVKR
jgi:hypothetical protein